MDNYLEAFWCVECDDPLEEDEDKFEHPMYDGEAVCEGCHDRIKAELEACSSEDCLF